MSKPSDLGSLKIGSYILLPVGDQPTGEPCRISEYDTSKPGKHGAAKARIVGVGVFDGAKRPHVGPVSMANSRTINRQESRSNHFNDWF